VGGYRSDPNVDLDRNNRDRDKKIKKTRNKKKKKQETKNKKKPETKNEKYKDKEREVKQWQRHGEDL
jgi:hypothetical protein